MSDIMIPVAIGELLDKISILTIKEARIHEPEKLANITREKKALTSICDQHAISYTDDLFADLKSVNELLWDIEDKIRLKEKSKEFDNNFIELARAVYVTNDKRFLCKSRINSHYGSNFREEKSYEDYS